MSISVNGGPLQWGMSPWELPASILRRLPVRFNYDDNYYASTYQGMPAHGYTFIVERMLDHPDITLYLGAGDVSWTRISGHKHFSSWETHENTLIFKE